MKLHKESGIITMSLMDLEHCGFKYEDFLGELFLNGIDDPEAERPILLMVDFVGGAVITDWTKKETLKKMKDAHNQFKNFVKMLDIQDDL